MRVTTLPFFLPLFIALSIGGCSLDFSARKGEKPIDGKDYVFSAADAPSEKKFKLTLASLSQRQLCTTNAHWPSAAGYMDSATRIAAVVVAGRKYPFKDFNMGACFSKECAIRVENEKRLEAELFYRDFELPEDLYDRPKELSFEPAPFWCDEARWID